MEPEAVSGFSSGIRDAAAFDKFCLKLANSKYWNHEMNRRYFVMISTICLYLSFVPVVMLAGETESSTSGKKAEGLCYPPIIQTGPSGSKVIHDRLTFIEQYKYDNWKPEQAAKGWDKDDELWKKFSWDWGKGAAPIQHRPMRVLDGLYVLGPEDYQQNTYLFDTGDGLLLVDCSYESFRPGIETQIRQLGYSLDQIKWVLLTHGHSDHAQSIMAYFERGAVVYLQADEPGIREFQAAVPPEISRKLVLVHDGDSLSFGPVTVEVIHTPGHTAGSSCFSLNWQGTGILVTGDVVSHFGRHASMDEGSDWNQYLASLWKLYRHPRAGSWQVILPGHSTIDLENGRDSIYRVLQVTSEIVRRRRAGEAIDWLNSYQFFYEKRQKGEPQIAPIEK